MNALTHPDFATSTPRARFLDLLDDSKALVSQYALAAWDAETADEINVSLQKASEILHQFSRGAAAIGFPEIAQRAEQSELQITLHLEGPYADLAVCPGEILWSVDLFVNACTSALDRPTDLRNQWKPDPPRGCGVS